MKPASSPVEAQLQQAVRFLQQGQAQQARILCARLLKQHPRQPDALHILGVLAHQAGKLDEARRLITQAATADPQRADFHANLGGVLQEQQQHERAVESYDRALALRPELMEAHYKRGLALRALGRNAEAIEAFDRVIALAPQWAPAFHDRGLVLHAEKRPAQAVADYDQAIALSGGDAETHYNRGNALQDLGRWEEAGDAYDRALAIDADLTAAHFNRGKALARLGRRAEAQDAFRRVLMLDPENTPARTALVWSQITDSDADLEPLMAEGGGAAAARSVRRLEARKAIAPFRAQHDLEQIDWLLAGASGGPARSSLVRGRETLKVALGRKPKAGVHPLSAGEIGIIAEARRAALRLTADDDVREGLNPAKDWRGLEDQYLSGAPQVVVIDDLLTAPALAALRRFCLGSMLWNAEYDNHYLGAFAVDGFATPLLLRIAAELREKMPRVFEGHALEQLWGFKYDQAMDRGINVHADFARVNLNFWITPDEANLDPASGGLVIYDTPAPKDWTFAEYNADPKRIYEFLAANGAGKRIVPYRCNRAVLFNSNLFHQTDTIRFRAGYENRRINITCLFGEGFTDWAV